MGLTIRDKVKKTIKELDERSADVAEMLRRKLAGNRPARAPVPVRSRD